MALIADHKFRRFNSSVRPHDVADGACAYMNCRRPRDEHKRAVSRNGTGGGWAR